MIDIKEKLGELTLEEKAALLAGHKSWHTNKVTRLGIPSIFLTDGPHGLRKKKEGDKVVGLGQTEPSTCFPAACTTGSSWNRDLLYEMGRAMGEECRHYGVNLILGPAVNIKRNPLCGRSFEYFSEDPLIAGSLGASLTRGIEDMGVGTSVKHFACNNNEANRYFGDSIVDERAYREIYLRAFEPIIKEGKPATVMCAYNKVNGRYASENEELLNGVLRRDWGFTGLVMSDWGAVNDRVEGLRAGLDLEMPGDVAHNRQAIIDAVSDGALSLETVDTAVARVLDMINNTTKCSEKLVADFDKNARLAKEISTEGAVLMKNDGILPLREGERYLAVGEMFEKMRYQGAGSSLINPYKLTQPKQAFDRYRVAYDYERGYNVDSFEDDEALMNSALSKAESYDTILFFGGLSEYAESEGFDRKTLSLPKNQLNLLRALAALGKRIVFVMFGGSPVLLDFDTELSAILNMYLPGEEGGESVYELLFGLANPSGRLVESWPLSLDSVPFSREFTATTNDRYKESIFVGYRYYSTYDVRTKYPFGYGLSYTSFAYDNMTAELEDGVYRVRLDVTNTGERDGKCVLQIYVEGADTDTVKPRRELRAFDKVFLKVGETKRVCLEISPEKLKYYINGAWRLENGEYTVSLCSDAETPLLSTKITVDSGEVIEENPTYRKLYAQPREGLLAMSDESFDSLIGREIASPEVARPYDLNTPMREYKTAGGKFLFGMIMFAFKTVYKMEKRAKDSPDKETKVKNAYFGWQTIASMSLRSISYASEGLLSHKMALVLLNIANNHPLKALAGLCKPEKCAKLPE